MTPKRPGNGNRPISHPREASGLLTFLSLAAFLSALLLVLPS